MFTKGAPPWHFGILCTCPCVVSTLELWSFFLPNQILILPNRTAVLEQSKLGFLRLDWQSCTGHVIFSHPFDLPWDNVEWHLDLTEISVVCLAFSAASQPSSGFPIVWPRTDLALCGVLRVACCVHTTPRSHFLADSDVGLNVKSGARIELPIQGEMFNILVILLNKYVSPMGLFSNNCSALDPTLTTSSRLFCDQCAALAPVYFRDELRERNRSLSPDPGQNLHPCWPWTQIRQLTTTPGTQYPLFSHPWPQTGELVFCDNLKGEFYSSSSAPPVQLDLGPNEEATKNHWIGITWSYAEPRTPVRIRVFPVPFSFVEHYCEEQILTGLEVRYSLLSQYSFGDFARSKTNAECSRGQICV